MYAPVIEDSCEGAFIAEEPIQIIKSGSYNHVPLIFGYTSREGMIVQMMRKTQPVIPDDFEEFVQPVLAERGSEISKSIAKQIKQFYYGENTPDNFYLVTIYFDVLFKNNTNFSASY